MIEGLSGGTGRRLLFQCRALHSLQVIKPVKVTRYPILQILGIKRIEGCFERWLDQTFFGDDTGY
jgi:hypothetical protein